MGLTPVQQAFIQNLFAMKAITNPEGIKLYNQCLDKDNGRKSRKITKPEEFSALKTKINKELDPIELRIQTAHSPWEGETYIGICNTLEDEAAKYGTSFHKSELALFFAIIEELREQDGEMLMIDAHNIVLSEKSTPKGNGRIIARLCEGRWLKQVRRAGTNTSIVPGARSLLELPLVRNWARVRAEQILEGKSEVKEQDVEVEDVAPRGRKRPSIVEDDDDDDEEEVVRRVSQGRRRASRR